MRGKQPHITADDSDMGSIPAHAGETTPEAEHFGLGTVNPRSCGGNPHSLPHHPLPSGQSPLMRGKRPLRPLLRCDGGSIPAHAGETHLKHLDECSEWVNPRSCGGKGGRGERQEGSEGQSPLMRGKHRDGAEVLDLARSIPAHAGETPCLGYSL